MQTPFDLIIARCFNSVTSITLDHFPAGDNRQKKSLNERRARANAKRLLFRKATFLEIRESQQKKTRNPCQFPSRRGELDAFLVPLDQFDAEEIFEFLDLPAVLALLHRVSRGRFDNAARRSHRQESLQAIQGKPTFGKESWKHDWMVQYLSKTQLSSLTDRAYCHSMNDLLSEKHAQIVEDILLEELGVNREQLTPEARLVEDLGADSLTVVEITMMLEDGLEISIPDEKSENARTVGELFEMLAELLKEKSRAHL